MARVGWNWEFPTFYAECKTQLELVISLLGVSQTLIICNWLGSSQILLAEGRPCWAVRQLWSVSRWFLLLFSCGKSGGTSDIYCGNMVECLKANLTELWGPTYGIAQNWTSSNSSILVPVLLSRHGWCSDFSLWLSASINLESLYLSVSNFGGQLFSCVPSPLWSFFVFFSL